MAKQVYLGSVYATMELQLDGLQRSVSSAKSQLGNLGSQIESTGSKSFSSFASSARQGIDSVADKIGTLIKSVGVLAVTSGAGLGAMAKLSFETARSLQNSAVSMKSSLGGSVQETQRIITDLVKYVQSNEGKLFDRTDVIAASKTLLAYGDSAAQVVEDTKVLSRAVIKSGTSFQDITYIYGKVISANKLQRESFDMLTERGINLAGALSKNLGVSLEEVQKRISNGTITANDFRKAMSDALPVSIVNEAASTIDGRLITLRTSFRNLGNALLGVDMTKPFDPIVKGGLLDLVMNAVDDLAATLKKPEIKQAFADLGKELGEMASKAIPAFINAIVLLSQNFDKVILVAKILIGTYVALRTASTLIGAVETLGKIKTGAEAAIKTLGLMRDGYIGIEKAAGNAAKVSSRVGQGAKVATTAGGDVASSVGTGVSAAAAAAATQAKTVFSAIFGSSIVQAMLSPFVQLGTKLAPIVAGIARVLVGVFTGPVGWITLAVTAVATIVAVLYSSNPAFKSWVDGVGKSIVDGFNVAVEWVKNAWNSVVAFFTDLGTTIGGVFSAIGSAISTAFGAVMTVLQPVIDVFNGIMYVITALATIITTIVVGAFQVLWTIISTLVQIIGVVLYGTLLKLGEFFALVWNGMVAIVSAVLPIIVNIVVTAWNNIVSFISTVLGVIGNAISTTWNFIVGIISGVMSSIWGVISSVWNTILGFIGPILSQILAPFNRVFNAIWSVVSSVVSNIWSTISSTFSRIYNTVASTIGNVANAVRSGMQSAYNAVTGFVGSFVSAGRNIIDGLVRGVSNGKDAIVGKVREICAGALDSVKSFFGIHSPSRVMAKMGGYLMEGFQNGIQSQVGAVVSSVTTASQKISDAFSPDMSMNSLQVPSSSFNSLMRNANTASGVMGGGDSSQVTQIYGNINIDKNRDDLDIIDKLNRGAVLARKGMATNV